MPREVGGRPVLRPLALGAAASVFEVLGEDGTRLAAKVAHTRVAAEQLTREHRVLRRLAHPSILRSHGLTRTDTQLPAMLLDLAEGVAAQSRVKAVARPGALARTHEAARIARHVADALRHAHTRGLVHRDVKGTNVCVRGDGHVWLLDFGIAAELSGEGTDYGIFVGTIPCAAPEQVAGGILSEATDAFALGALLYRMLLARRPFEAETPDALMAAHRAGPPPPPHVLLPPIPRNLSRLTAELLVLDPNDRPTLDEACATLDTALTELREQVARDPMRGFGSGPGAIDLGPRETDST